MSAQPSLSSSKKDAGDANTGAFAATDAERYERRLMAIYATMEQQDFRAYRRARQLAMKLKHEQGLTQQEMAERVGWSQGNLALYLNGTKAIGRNVLPLLCIALGAEPHEIRTELKDPRDIKEREMMYRALIKQEKRLKRWMNRDGVPSDLIGEISDEYKDIKAKIEKMSHSNVGFDDA